MQIKHCFAAVSDDVHMSWPMVVRIDDYAQPKDSEYGWHYIKNPNRLGLFFGWGKTVKAAQPGFRAARISATFPALPAIPHSPLCLAQ